jgi:hypothetical protein
MSAPSRCLTYYIVYHVKYNTSHRIVHQGHRHRLLIALQTQIDQSVMVQRYVCPIFPLGFLLGINLNIVENSVFDPSRRHLRWLV